MKLIFFSLHFIFSKFNYEEYFSKYIYVVFLKIFYDKNKKKNSIYKLKNLKKNKKPNQ